MKKNTLLKVVIGGSLLLLFAFLLINLPAIAQETDQGPIEVNAEMAVADAPLVEQPELFNSPPALTDAQKQRMQWAEANTDLSPAVDTANVGEIPAPAPGTESTVEQPIALLNQPLAPGDATIYSSTQFGNIIPSRSNYMDSSTDGRGLKMFYTGNFFLANSVNKGVTWKYLSPYSGFADFCCSQISLYDSSRDVYFWLRTGTYDSNGQNVFKLSVDVNNPFNTSYWTYTFAPTNANINWTNQFWDSPHMQLGADYLYVSWNLFNQSFSWVNTVMLRLPIDALAAGVGFGFSYYAQPDWFTFIPVSGADHAMYFASNWDSSAPYDSLRIWRWYESSGGLTYWTKTVPAWTTSPRGSVHCGTPNWLARADMRILTGARYEISSDGIAEPRQPGRKILGWWWNVAEGNGFTYPYINGAAFYEDTMDLLPGYIGRPYMYGSDCFAYPSFTPNTRGDLGGVFDYATSTAYQKPNVGFAIADDFATAPPGWTIYSAANSNAGPSDAQWGPHNSARNYQSGATWIAGSQYIPGSSNCANCSVPLWLAFGRERDTADFVFSCQIAGTCIPFASNP